jgi:hydroxyacylglutathione hydrolase
MLTIDRIAAFSDNYIWVLSSSGDGPTMVVDPGDAAPVRHWLQDQRRRLGAILITHHHADHTGGVRELNGESRVPVLGPARPELPYVTDQLRDGSRVSELGISLEVLSTPGHTRDHLSFVGEGFALTGDTLFTGGCGRLFEGDAEQMHASLMRLAALPPTTMIYCGHEYTAANLGFALEVEPENAALRDRLQRVLAARRAGCATVPSTLAEELATNPFLRCGEAAVVMAACRFAGHQLSPGAETLAVVRRWKDGWTPAGGR